MRHAFFRFRRQNGAGRLRETPVLPQKPLFSASGSASRLFSNGIRVSFAQTLTDQELDELAEASEQAIRAGGGFGWLSAPPRETLRAFWRGCLMIPERHLFVGKHHQAIVGAVQLVRYPITMEARQACGVLTAAFVAPRARKRGVAEALLKCAMSYAYQSGLLALECEIRATQTIATSLYTRLGFTVFGRNPHYAFVNGSWVEGVYMSRVLAADT